MLSAYRTAANVPTCRCVVAPQSVGASTGPEASFGPDASLGASASLGGGGGTVASSVGVGVPASAGMPIGAASISSPASGVPRVGPPGGRQQTRMTSPQSAPFCCKTGHPAAYDSHLPPMEVQPAVLPSSPWALASTGADDAELLLHAAKARSTRDDEADRRILQVYTASAPRNDPVTVQASLVC
jgi:hypothetical protein